jgi:predicted  nucleic acid-binding Zn-ribbon protein
MIEVPDRTTITGLTRTELIALIYALKKERDDAKPLLDEWQAVSEFLSGLYEEPAGNMDALRRLRKECDDAHDKLERSIAIIRDRAKRARDRHAVDKTNDSFLNDGDLARFYDVLAGEIEALK